MVGTRQNNKGHFLFTICILIVTILGVLASYISCAPAPTPSASPIETHTPVSSPVPVPTPLSTPTPFLEPAPTLAIAPTPPPDATPPSAVTGLVVADAYDGKVNLWWDKSTAEDFVHYNVYISESAITDVTGITPVHQVRAISMTNYQATELKADAKYYFAVTAVDKTGNEDKRVACVDVTTTPMPRGTASPDISVDSYQSDKAWPGTTLLPFNYTPGKPRIIEVNMLGEIIWEYQAPRGMVFDVELLPNNNVLFTIYQEGVYEVNREGEIVWSYLDKKVSHDADRLPDGNTLFVWGWDAVDDAQVKEVNTKGEMVWDWYAKDYFNKSPYKEMGSTDGGDSWLHVNAVQRLPNGNTLISARNFNFVIEVDAQGSLISTIGEGALDEQHDPEILPNGNLIATIHNSLPDNRGKPQRAVEIDPKTGNIVWQFPIPGRDNWPVRDANRLPNGNTLITGLNRIVEVTPQGEIVWRLTLSEVVTHDSGRGFYKAERIDVPE
jgi:hypothetical protein